MQSWKRALGYGFLLWLIPFILALLITPIRTGNRIFFETIMPVTITVSCVILALLYFRRVQTDFLSEGVRLGALWFVISVAIDLLMFSWGPMAMSFPDYMLDIGLTYLIFPAITIGFGYLLVPRQSRV